jgi:hypothetical protein
MRSVPRNAAAENAMPDIDFIKRHLNFVVLKPGECTPPCSLSRVNTSLMPHGQAKIPKTQPPLADFR